MIMMNVSLEGELDDEQKNDTQRISKNFQEFVDIEPMPPLEVDAQK